MQAENIIEISKYTSPVGELILGSFAGRLCMCDWNLKHRRTIIDRRIRRYLNADFKEGCPELIKLTVVQLEEYFNGDRMDFSIPLQFAGTEFQCKVWTELMKIPYGKTISYAELAAGIGNPKAVRAMASANAANPISIIVPCHRVIGSNQKLTGYAGGLHAKETLLNLEAKVKSQTHSNKY